MSGKDWRPPAEIELLDEGALALVDELIRTLAGQNAGSDVSAEPSELKAYDPYEEANLGWLKAAREAADSM